MIKEAIELLGLAQDAMAQETLIVSKINGTKTTEQIIKLNNQIYALICRVIEILSEVEEL